MQLYCLVNWEINQKVQLIGSCWKWFQSTRKAKKIQAVTTCQSNLHTRSWCRSSWVPPMQHVQENQMFRHSQHRFMRGRSCLNNLISYDKMTYQTKKKNVVIIVYLDINEAFGAVSHILLLEKMAAHSLNWYTVPWLKNWLVARSFWMQLNLPGS